MQTLSPEALEDAWAQFREGDDEARNELILHYYDFVSKVATTLVKTMPPSVDLRDLVSYGIFGLLDAMKAWDPNKNDRFEGFAYFRVRGSILDEVRRVDPVPRTMRSQARQIEVATDALWMDLNRQPTDEEVAERLGVSMTEFTRLSQAASHQEPVSLAVHHEEQVLAPDPASLFEVGEVAQIVADAIAQMPPKDQAIIALCYLEGMTLGDIGEVFGVTESRICQLQGQILRNLRGHLGGASDAA